MLKPKLQYFVHLMRRADSLGKIEGKKGKIEGKRKRGQQRVRWLDNITSSLDRNLSKLHGIVKDKGIWHDIVSPWGRKESDTT